MPLRFYSWCSTRGAHGNLARNCEGTEQLPYIFKLSKNVVIEPLAVTESV